MPNAAASAVRVSVSRLAKRGMPTQASQRRRRGVRTCATSTRSGRRCTGSTAIRVCEISRHVLALLAECRAKASQVAPRPAAGSAAICTSVTGATG